MKLLTSSAMALALLANSAAANGELVIYHWFEYLPAELIEKFTAETGINVTMDTYDSNEAMLASLKAGGMGTYDVAVPTDYMVTIMAGEGLLDTVADGELANKGNIAPEWADPSFDPGWTHSVPYQWGSTSFSVNTEVIAVTSTQLTCCSTHLPSCPAKSTCSIAKAKFWRWRPFTWVSRNAQQIVLN